MRSALWLPLLAAVVVVTACQEATPPVRLDVIPTPNPAIADAIHRLRSGGFFFYEGLEWIEEAILRADVIARVSLQSTRTFVKEKDSRWFPVLEYRFQVHEYLKGSGPNEIGGLTYLWNKPSETEALAVAREMPTAHDTRWDNREAIVFLETDHRPYGYTTGIQIAADQHWFGLMIVGLGINAVSVSSIHSKRWLPEVAVATRGRASTDKLFLTDAPPTDPPPVGGGAARSAATSTLPTITLSTLKGRITELETEASAGGTDMYRACITGGYTKLRSMAYKAQERGVPRMRDSTVKSGLPAGTHADIPFHGAYSRTTSTPAIWKINGPDREIVRFVTVNWRPEGTVFKYDFQLVTTRPLPADTYAIYPNWRYKYCDKDLSAIENHTGITLTVTAHPRAVHDAFFDPVDIGAAVGADGTTTGAPGPCILCPEWRHDSHREPEMECGYRNHVFVPYGVPGRLRHRLHRRHRHNHPQPHLRQRQHNRSHLERPRQALGRRRPAHAHESTSPSPTTPPSAASPSAASTSPSTPPRQPTPQASPPQPHRPPSHPPRTTPALHTSSSSPASPTSTAPSHSPPAITSSP